MKRFLLSTAALVAFGATAQAVNQDYNFNLAMPDPFNTTATLTANVAYAYPAYTYTPLTPGGASQALMFSIPGEFPRGPLPITHMGQSMNFVSIGSAFANPFPVVNNANAVTTRTLNAMIRYD